MKLPKLLILLLFLTVFVQTGCEIMPVIRYKPTLHNPFPQIQSIAVVPFYNYTDNSKVDGREFAQAFSNELQKIPGFRVIANKIVEETMLQNDLQKFESVDDIRYLAQLLNVDAVVIGKIHGFSMNYPPFIKFETEWYAVNPYFHPIPPGRNLPWGTEHEEFIPDKVVLLAEMELASAQLKTQTPEYEPVLSPAERKKKEKKSPNETESEIPPDYYFEPQEPKSAKRENPIRLAAGTIPNNMGKETSDESVLSQYAEYRQERSINKMLEKTGVPYIPEAVPLSAEDQRKEEVKFSLEMPHPLHAGPWRSETFSQNQNPWSDQNQYPLFQQNQINSGLYQGHYAGFPQPIGLTPEELTQYGWINQPIMPVLPLSPLMPGMPVEGQPGMVMGEPNRFPGLPADWPDPRGFIPESPEPERPKREIKNNAPFISHINIYNGNDSELMQALYDYDFLFRDDKRIAGKQSILNNRNEFTGFCCRLHIWEIFSARGGAGTAEKVTRRWKPWQGGERPF
ncbi:MAG: hypothetical protein LBE12_10070 [Planctomycetaceae bacterium]|jgi:hypothetical protein|nr:hypothetical protein [Planctomycetaceae bacterium]